MIESTETTAAPVKVKNPHLTKWAKRLKKEAPYFYEESLALVKRLGSVTISQKDDHSFKGDYTWAITPDVAPDFWLDSFDDLEQAKKLCRVMGWRVEAINQASVVNAPLNQN